MVAPPDPERRADGSFAFAFPASLHVIRESALVCGIVAVAAALYYRIWAASLGTPWWYSSDANFGSMLTKSLMENGWYLRNPRIGAPFGGNLADYPQGGETIHFVIQKLLGGVLSNYAAVDNVYLLLTYFLVALSAYFVTRYLGFAVGPALLVGVLYSFLPYHQYRGELQLARSGYYWVPVVIVVLLWLLAYRDQLYRPGARGGLTTGLRWGRLAAAGAICAFLGINDTQNAAFAASFLIIIGLGLAFHQRDLRPLVLAGALTAVIAAALVLANLPYVLEQLAHGANHAAGNRGLDAQEVYALRITELLLPVDGHRFGPLAELTRRARSGEVLPGEQGQALGVVGDLGLLAGMACLVGSVSGRSPREGTTRPLLTQIGLLGAIGVLIGSVGGFSYLLSIGGLTSYRTWNRISIFIAFFALLGAALLVRAISTRLTGHRMVAEWGGLGVIALIVVSLFDLTSPMYVPNYHQIDAKFNVDQAFFHQLEAQLPARAMVFEYPVVPFPESPPVGAMTDYEQFIGYLHTSTLRWSYGAVKGRPDADWQTEALSELPPVTAAGALASAGFSGIYINRSGYTDDGRSLESQLAPVLGAPVLVSSDSRLVYYDLGGVRTSDQQVLGSTAFEALGRDVLSPVVATFAEGFYPEDGTGAAAVHPAEAQARIDLDNPDEAPRPVRLSAAFGGNGPGTVTVTGPAQSVTIPFGPAPATTRWTTDLLLPPGHTGLRLTTAAPPVQANGDTRAISAEVSSFSLLDQPVDDAACRLEQPATRPADCP